MLTREALRVWVLLGAATITWMAVASTAPADWPTYRHDAARSGVTDETVAPPLRVAWVHRPPQPPQPAWPPPASNDYWHKKHGLTPRVTYDRAYHVVVAGEAVFFGTSADDRLVCLDLDTGQSRWTFFAEGPVRLAPTVAGGRVYAGADDGRVYCLSASDGRLIWKRRIAEDDACCIGNGRLISRWPIRTGVAVRDGVAYAAAGLFPDSEGVYLAAYDAATGQPRWRRRIEHSPQGYLAATADRLVLPTGRTTPALFSRQDGKPLGVLKGQGGDHVQVAGSVIAAGPGDTGGALDLSDTTDGVQIINMIAMRVAIRSDDGYTLSQHGLAAIDWPTYVTTARRQTECRRRINKIKRKKDEASKAEVARLTKTCTDLSASLKACRKWQTPEQHASSLILAGPVLFAGGKDEVAAYRTADGQRCWSGKVNGQAYGLAAAGGRLLVSTDTGEITCFRPGGSTPSVPGHPKTGHPPSRAGGRGDPSGTRHTRTAKTILDAAGVRRGICLVLGAGTGRLARALAEASDLQVLGVEPDAAKVAEARRHLADAGLYGRRVAILHREGRLPYPPYMANLIVSGAALERGAPLTAMKGLWRLVRPCGGTLCLGPAADRQALDAWLQAAAGQGAETERLDRNGLWGLARRGPLPGTGEWTHGLADPGNTACSMDRLVGGPLRVQWFGRPGPDQMADRHHRNVSPLYKNGRLFVPGDNRVIVLDAYNGTPIWEKALPDSLRLGVFLDCSNMVVDAESLYVTALDTCHVFDIETGATRRHIALPQLDPNQPHEWGYVARAGELLVASGRLPKASYWQQSHQADSRLWGDAMRLVTSDYLVAMDARTGSRRWDYRSCRIINTTLAIGGGRVYFLENHSPKARENTSGRVRMIELLDGTNHLTALDLKTGRVLWQQPRDLRHLQHIAYLSYADDTLILSGNEYIEKRLWYHVYAIAASNGKVLWHHAHNSGYGSRGSHGEQNRHPTLVGDTVYAYPLAYTLATGKPVEEWRFARHGHGCGNISASLKSLFWRGGNPWRWDLGPDGRPHRLNTVTRPGCFINMIPAGGLLLIPEASSGCTCPFSIQTSIAYIPAESLEDDDEN